MTTLASRPAGLRAASAPLAARGAPSADDWAKLVLRLALGVLTLLHGLAKLKTGPGFVLMLLQQHGLPGFLAYGVYVGEVIAPALVLLGLFTRPAAAVIVVNMLVAFGLVHMADLFSLGKQGGWALELQGFFLFTALAVAIQGGGRIGLDAVRGRAGGAR